MILTIGWGLGFLVTKGVEKLLGYRIKDEDISAESSTDESTKHIDFDIVAKDNVRKSDVSAERSAEDERHKYFGFEDFFEDCVKHRVVSAESSSEDEGFKYSGFEVFAEDNVKHSDASAESSSEDEGFEYSGFEVFAKDNVKHSDASAESSSEDEGFKYSGFDIVAEDNVKVDGISGEFKEDKTGKYLGFDIFPEDQKDIDASSKVEEVAINTHLTVNTSGDIVALESVCLPDNKMELEFEIYSGDTEMNIDDTPEFFDDFVEQMAVKESCDSKKNLMNFEEVFENPSTEETASVDVNSMGEIKNYTDHFENLDTKYMDDSPKEVDSGSRNAAKVVSHIDEVSEYSSSEEWSSDEESSIDDIENDPDHYDSIYAKDVDASTKDEEVCSGSPNAEDMWTEFGEVYKFSSSEESSSEEENSEDGTQNDTDDFEAMDVNIYPGMYFCKFSNSFFNSWMNATTQSTMNLTIVRRFVAQYPEEISELFAETPLFARCFFTAMYHPGRDFPPHEIFAVQNELVETLKIKDVKHQDKPGVLLFYMLHYLAQCDIYTNSKLYTTDYCEQCQKCSRIIRNLGPVIPLPKEQQNDTTSTLLENYWSGMSESCDTCKSNKKRDCFFNETDVMTLILPWPDSPDDIRHPVIPDPVLDVPVKNGTQLYHLSSIICRRQETTSDTSSFYTYLMCGELVFKAEDERVTLENIDCGADVCSNGYIYIYEKATEGQDEYSVGLKVTTDQQQR